MCTWIFRSRTQMSNDTELLEHLYDRFNARDLDAVLATMHPDVVWANGLEGGFVYGHDGVRNCWTRQWAASIFHIMDGLIRRFDIR